MIEQVFAQDPIYEIVIAHPRGNEGTVTVRSVPSVSGSEYRGFLRNKTGLKGTLDFRPNGDIWARITECLTNPSVEGYYCALKYSGKVFATYKLENSPTPTGRPPLYFVKHDYEIGFTRAPRNAPEVHYLDHYTKLTKPWQLFWWNLNRPAGVSDAETKRQFKKYTANDAFITDQKGSDTRADYINGTNLDKEPIEIKCLFCGGNVITGDEVFEGGKWWLYPKFIDAFKDPTIYAGMTNESHPWFIHRATNIGNDLPDGTRRVNPMGWFSGRNTGIPDYYIFVGNPNKLTRYPLNWLFKLGVDEAIPNTYNPNMI